MRFKPLPRVIPGTQSWGAVVRGRYSFCIVFTDGLGYSATWKDSHDINPRQAIKIADDLPTYAEAERACRDQEKRLRPN